MSDAIRFLDGLLEERLAHLHTCMPARVTRYDAERARADVQPLYMRRDRGAARPVPLPLLTDLPVLRRRILVDEIPVVETPHYEPGDIVLIAFAERALDRVLGGAMSDPGYSRKHALEDGIVLGLLMG